MLKVRSNSKLFLFSVAFALGSLYLNFAAKAATIKGIVLDSRNGEPLIAALLHIDGTDYTAASGLDGTFVIKNIPAGKYQVVCEYLDYINYEHEVSIRQDTTIYLEIHMQSKHHELDEITIVGAADRETDESARKSEQKADNVMNILGAKAIQLLPDITVGNILQRVSGVSVQRNSSGDGQYAIIRGMDKRYNYTLVNGIKIPSPDNKNRYVPMDIFPAELLERLEVTKALTPNMEGDAIGGAMNMVMKSPTPNFTATATVAGGYSDMLNSSRPFLGFSASKVPDKSPSALHGATYAASPSDFGISQLQYKKSSYPVNSLLSVSMGGRILNGKLGILVAGSNQRIFRGTNSVFYQPNEPSATPYPNTYLFGEVQIRQYSTEQNRSGVHAKLDFQINNKNKLTLYNGLIQLNEWQHRTYANPQAKGLATVDVQDRSRYTAQRIISTSLRGDHVLIKNLKLDWTAAYALATSNTPAWSDMNVRYRYNDSSQLVSVQLLPLTQIWTNNRDEDKSGYLNLAYQLHKSIEISAGGLARYKSRQNNYVSYELNTLGTNGEYQNYTSIDRAVFSFLPASSAVANPYDPNNYRAVENITAMYVMAKYNLMSKVQLVGGIRNEYTYQEYHSELTPTKEGRDGTISYSDLLPSLHVKYELSPKQNLRASYYAAVARPNYYEFVPVEIPGDYFTETGNYRVKHSTADNYDLRYELFNNSNEQLFAGVFYKSIKNPIEYGFQRVTATSSFVTPQNYGTATNYGFEFVVTKYIRNFGLSANYTFTNSSITTQKLLKSEVNTGSGTTIVNALQDQTRPLQGQSKHIANVSFLYKNPAKGLDLQLAWVYTGRRINLVSPYKDLDYWQRGFSQFDFSAEKTVSKKFRLFFKVTNLLNTPLIVEVKNKNYLNSDAPAQDRSDAIVVQKDIFKQTFLLGLRYKL